MIIRELARHPAVKQHAGIHVLNILKEPLT